MAQRKLKNYLRTHRKKLGLTQKELAFLLSCECEAKVSRYERFKRRPNLESALACEVIFQIPVGELFAGMLEQVKATTARRILLLADRLDTLQLRGGRKSALEIALRRHPLIQQDNE